MRRPPHPQHHSPSLPRAARRCLFLLVCLPLAWQAPGQDGSDGTSLGLRLGTTGYGPELAIPVGDRLGLRLAAGLGSFDVDFDSRVVTYEGEVEFQNLLAVVDLRPTGGAFRFSAGALLNDNTLSGTAPIRDVLLDNGIAIPNVLAGLDLGSLDAEAGVEQVAPYVGLGFGGGRRAGSFQVALDVGVAYHGEPDVSLQVRDLPAAVAAIPGGRQLLDAVLAVEERELEAELEEYRYFPVLALTFAYSF